MGEGLGTVRCPVTLPLPIRAAGGPSSNSQRYSRTCSFPTGDSALESPNSTLGFTLLDRESVDSGLQEIRSVGCGENLGAAAESLHGLSAFLSVKWARSSQPVPPPQLSALHPFLKARSRPPTT